MKKFVIPILLCLSILAACPVIRAAGTQNIQRGATFTQHSDYVFTADRDAALIGKIAALGRFDSDRETVEAFRRWLPTVEPDILSLNVDPALEDYAYIPYVSYSFRGDVDAELRLSAIRSGVTTAVYAAYSLLPEDTAQLRRVAGDIEAVTGIVLDISELRGGLLEAGEQMGRNGVENYNVFYETADGSNSLLYTAVLCDGEVWYSIQATGGVEA